MSENMKSVVPCGARAVSKAKKGVGLIAILACMAAAPRAGAVDGTCWQASNPMNWSGHNYSWVNCIVARDGGVATFTAGTRINQDENNLVLGGIDFTTSSPYLYGKDITLTGDAFLRGTKYLSGNTWQTPKPVIAAKLKGTGSNTITKRGVAEITLCSPFTDIGALDMAEGTLAMTNAPATFLTDVAVRLHGGNVAWRPVLAAGQSASATLGATGGISYGTGSSEIHVAHGNGASATLTLGPLTREPNGTLFIVPEGGLAALGVTEFVKCATPPPVVNGMVTPTILARDNSTNGWPFAFLTYDADRGFVPAAYTAGLEGGSTSIAYVGENTVLTNDAHVYALVVDHRARLVITNGVTLTVGDGVNPAAVIFNARSADTDYDRFEGGGTLAFGNSEGIIYHNAPSAGRGIYLYTAITGSGDLNLVNGKGPYAAFFCTGNGFLKQEGALHVSCARVWPNNTNISPNNDEIYLHGGDQYWGALLLASGTYSKHFHVGGIGSFSTDTRGVIAIADSTLTLSGAVTLMDDSLVSTYYQSNPGTLNFNKPIDGTGDLSMRLERGCAINLNATNTYSGATAIEATHATSPGTVALGAGGTFGDGPVTANNLSVILFKTKPGASMTNAIDSTGTVKFEYVSTSVTRSKIPTPNGMDFDGPVSAATLEMNRGTAIGVGTNLTVGAVTGSFGESVIRATRDGVAFTIGRDGADNEVAARLEDGAGSLSLVKVGTNTVTLCGTKTYSGTTTIENGTLRLSPAILESPDIAYWLDATRPDTLTCDENGNVTTWASANGNGVSFVKNGSQLLPKYSANFLNDKPSVVFTATGTGSGTYNNLIGNKSVTQRSVFIVTKTTATTAAGAGTYPGIFGANGNDYGQRIQDGATHWRTASTGYTFITPANNLAVNGVMGNGTFTMNVPYVLTMIHADDALNNTGPIFTPNLGGYSANGFYNGGISEVIAFNRLLSEAERKTVENYLAAKWGVNAQLHANVEPTQTLPPTANVVLRAPGALDLNGADQTVATLTGEGMITNSSPNAATLTVTGACNFSGKIAGNVTLVRGGSGSTALDLRGAGNVTFNGGETSLSAYDYTPPQDGLLYWLDASCPSTIHTNAAGVVTNWSSRVADMPAGPFKLAWGAVTYDEAVPKFGGLPAVHFAQHAGLVAQNETDTWTLFLVACYDGAQTQFAGLFGWYGKDFGFRVVDTTGKSVNIGTGSAWTRVGDYLRVNKVQHTSLTTSNITVPNTAPYVLSCRLAGWQKTVASRVCRNALNGYLANNRGAVQWIAEVIAYDRALSDEEIGDVESYLYDKWVAGGGVERNARVCNGTGGVALQGGAVVNASAPVALNALSAGAGGGTLNGDVELDGPLVVEVDANGDVQTVRINGDLTIGASATVIVNDYTKTDKRERYTVVSVSGNVTGTFASTNVDKPWHLYRVNGTWYLLGVDGTTLIFR